MVKGISGIPGELRGVFLTGSGAIGNISLSNDKGIYGCLTEDSMERLGGREMYIGTSSMVKEGPATIYTTIDDDGPKEYSVEIVKVSPSKVNSTKGLVCLLYTSFEDHYPGCVHPCGVLHRTQAAEG